MKTVLHKADSRGHMNHGWLDAHHSFSFANYYNPERISFGALRVLNDDAIEPGMGFGRHPHDNMEIITIPLEGKVLHRDSMGNEEFLHTGEVQVMSAGTGIFHEEYNGSKTSALKLLQIWIEPRVYDIKPSYKQKAFDSEKAVNNWQTLVGPNGVTELGINQSAYISRTFLTEGNEIQYRKNESDNATYFFLIDGKINIEKTELNTRDALGISEFETLTIKATENAHILAIETP